MKNAVFADTFYWIALTTPGDAAHRVATAFDAASSGIRFVTTDEVLSEFLTFFGSQGPFLRRKAVVVVRRILRDRRVTVLPQTRQSFEAGFSLYAARPDKSYSLTDCISMETMRREALAEVLTSDHHFAEGFVPILVQL